MHYLFFSFPHQILWYPIFCPPWSSGRRDSPRVLPQDCEVAGRIPEPLTQQPHPLLAQVIQLQIQLSQAAVGAQHRGQILTAAGCDATADQPAGEMHSVIC